MAYTYNLSTKEVKVGPEDYLVSKKQTKSYTRPYVVAYAYSHSTQEVEIGESEAQGQPQMHTKFEASLGYIRCC